MPYGYGTQGDALVNKLADGVDLHTVWNTIGDLLEVWNDERTSVAKLLSYPTVKPAEALPQKLNAISFETASEFGVPVAVAPPKDVLKLGATLIDFDARTGFTWRYLRQADSRQVNSVINDIAAADDKNLNGTVIKRILNPAPESNEMEHVCYGLWSGDGMVPLPHLGNSFDGNHSHYISSQSTQIDSGDIEDAIDHIVHHGYGTKTNSDILILANPQDGQFIQSWRKGEESRPSGPTAKYDFVHSSVAPPYFSAERIIGEEAPAEIYGVKVWGSYGRGYLLESNYVPAGYVIVAASGGPDSVDNVCALRQPEDFDYQGLLRIPGNDRAYPLVDSFFLRSVGAGVRHRSAAVAIQVTPSPVYTAPADSLIFV